MYEWKVEYSETKKEGTRISFECWTATVFAENEAEVRAIMAEEEPDKDIDKITRGELVDDDDDT